MGRSGTGRTWLTDDEVRALAFVLAASRAGWGLLQFTAPGVVDRMVVRRDVRPAGRSPSRVGWRMKGVRDAAVGVMGVVAPTATLPVVQRIGVAVDAGDTLATLADGGRTLRPHVLLVGTLAGVVSVAIGVAVAGRDAS